MDEDDAAAAADDDDVIENISIFIFRSRPKSCHRSSAGLCRGKDTCFYPWLWWCAALLQDLDIITRTAEKTS